MCPSLSLSLSHESFIVDCGHIWTFNMGLRETVGRLRPPIGVVNLLASASSVRISVTSQLQNMYEMNEKCMKSTHELLRLPEETGLIRPSLFLHFCSVDISKSRQPRDWRSLVRTNFEIALPPLHLIYRDCNK